MLHGGNLTEAATRYGRPVEDWLDLSTGINPVSYPVGAIPPEAWQRLPDAGREAELSSVARLAYGVPRDAGLVAAPGTQPLIQLAARLVAQRTVAIVGPTYSEHATAWQREGHDVIVVGDLDAARDASVIVVVNPNNPDGRTWSPRVLKAVAQKQAECSGLLVVDEAFVDVSPDMSMAPLGGMPGLLVLRSFGKFYGLAGVRLGFAIGTEQATRRLGDLMGPWAVSGPAIEVGLRALGDVAWAIRQRQRIVTASVALHRMLTRHGLELIGGAGLFTLVNYTHAIRLQSALAEQGIWTRVFDYEPDWMRFGLPGDEGQFARLDQALAAANTRLK